MSIKEMSKKNYERGLWTVEMLQALVAKGKLTQEDLNEIVGGTASA